MALNGTVQPQLDVTTTAFTASKMLLALVKATQMDNVHPAAVLALEAIGSSLIVEDHHLINKALEVLDKDTSYRIDHLKLQLGLSVKGIQSQIRESTAAVKGFILIAALRHTLDARLIGEVLYELLKNANLLQHHLISKPQLADLVEAVESHAYLLRDDDALANTITIPALFFIARRGVDHIESFFSRVDPEVEGKCLHAAFNAIRNNDITQIELRGIHSGLEIASTLWYICGNQLQVLADDGTVIIPSDLPNPKVSLVFCLFAKSPTSHLWHSTEWHGVTEISNIFKPTEDASIVLTTDIKSPFVPKREVYFHFQGLNLFTEEEISAMGTLTLGIVKAAWSCGILTTENESNQIPFWKVCREELLSDPVTVLEELGWSRQEINIEYVDGISLAFGREYRRDEDVWTESGAQSFLTRILQRATGGKLLQHKSRRSTASTLFLKSIALANFILLRATHYGSTEFPRRYLYHTTEIPPIISKLLGIDSQPLIALEYLREALTSIQGLDSVDKKRPAIALSDRGTIAYLRSLVEVPTTIPEAFAIMVQPGQIKWSGASMKMLSDGTDPPHFTTDPTTSWYHTTDNKPGSPSLYIGSGKLKYSIQTSADSKIILLRCQQPHSTDNITRLTRATVNWALSHRPSQSGISKKELFVEEGKNIPEQLELRHPNSSGLHSTAHFPSQTMGIVGYYDDERANFMRYGTFDAECLACITEGPASRLDCIIYARQHIDKGWLIFARP